MKGTTRIFVAALAAFAFAAGAQASGNSVPGGPGKSGDFVWHKHDDEDELFFVQKGTLEMQFRDRTEIVNEGELIVVPKGVEHCPRTRDGEEVHLLLFEKLSVKHTGDLKTDRTVEDYPEI